MFVPEDAEPAVLERLGSLDARITVCERHSGSHGDPTVERLRQAIADGALPFTCQGDLNGLAIEGGHTLGWEIAAAGAEHRPHRRPGRAAARSRAQSQPA